MISRDFFCQLLKIRDAQFKKECQLSLFLTNTFSFSNGRIPDCETVFMAMDALTALLAELFSDDQQLIRESLWLEYPDESETAEITATLPDGTVRIIHDYGGLYDHLVERMRCDESVGQQGNIL